MLVSREIRGQRHLTKRTTGINRHRKRPWLLESTSNGIIHVRIHRPRSSKVESILKKNSQATSLSNQKVKAQTLSPTISPASDSTSMDNETPDRQEIVQPPYSPNRSTSILRTDVWANTMDYSKRDQRKKKKEFKCSRWLILIVISAIGCLLVLPAAILVPLLLRSTPKKMPNRTAELRWNTTGITIAGVTGINGNVAGRLSNPWGLAISDDYSLYLTDRYNHRIQKYLRGSSIGITVAGSPGGVLGTGNNSLSGPSSIILDTDQNLFIADAENHRIQFWPSGASAAVTIAGDGTSGSGLNQLSLPYGVTKDWSSDVLYVADFVNARIMTYRSGSTSGSQVFGGSGNGFNTNQVNSVVAIHFDAPSNSFLIVNRDSHNVVRWKLGESTWTIVAGSASGIRGNASTTLSNPHGLTVDPMGNIYVADADNHRIQFFPAGRSSAITIVGMTGHPGNNNSSFNRCFGIALDNQLNLYVSDYLNFRVQKFLRY